MPDTLWCEPLDHPRAVALPRIAQAVVEPVLAPHPELDRVRHDAVAAPERWQRDLAAGVLALQAPVLRFQYRTIRDDAALSRGPRREATSVWAGPEVLLGLAGGDSLHPAVRPNLPAKRVPIEDQRGARVLGQLTRLAALVVGVEDEPAVVHALQQHHPGRWDTVGSRGGERHRVGLRDPRLLGQPVPAPELGQGVGVEVPLG